MAKMEMKIKELEAELASTQSRTGEASKAYREPSARQRSLPLLLERTRRTKTAWLILLASFKERSRHTSNRLRRLKKLLHSTWPSSGRLNRTLKRLRKELSSPWSCKL